MMRDSVTAPAEAAERLLALRPRTAAIVEAAVLVAALNSVLVAILSGGTIVMSLPEGDLPVPPLLHAVLLLASLVLSASGIQVGGRILGGRGRFPEALLVVTWLQVLAVAVQVVLVLASLVAPPLAGLVGLAGLAVLLWCLLQFTRALHGFSGLGRALLSVLLGALLIGLALWVLLETLGFGVAPDV